MADDQEIRRINWAEVFSFTQIFKSFRMAMHFSKLLLALAAIVLVYLIGTAMDGVWGLGGQTVAPGEIAMHFATNNADFDKGKSDWIQSRPKVAADLVVALRREKSGLGTFQTDYVRGSSPLRDAFLERLAKNREELAKDKEKEKAEQDKLGESADDLLKKTPDKDDLLKLAQEALDAEVARIESLTNGLEAAASEKIDKLPEGDRAKARLELKQALGVLRTGVYHTKLEFRRNKTAITGQPIFKAFRQYELACLSNSLTAVQYGNFTGGMALYRERVGAQATVGAPEAVLPKELGSPRPAEDTPGFIYWVLLAIQGFGWLLSEHYLYGVVFLLLTLAVWALFGGAIHRIAALHAAREEKMSAMQALRFSIGKFGAFLTAPLLPMGLVLLLGLGVLAGGALISIPGVHVVFSLLFVVVLIAALAIAFLLVGWFFGGALMYPTIAVEGSDAFDAMSRSFSYVLNRPWRALLYALVAVVYGTITYLFVRFFAYLGLLAAHTFAKAGSWGGDAMGPWADQVDLVWTKPTFDNLMGAIPWDAMSGMEKVTAAIIAAHLFVVAALVTAYFLSYFASASTVIYLLLRRQVDATDTDDVYMDEPEEDLPAPETFGAPEAAPAAEPVASMGPAATAPEAQPPQSPTAEPPPDAPTPPAAQPPSQPTG